MNQSGKWRADCDGTYPYHRRQSHQHGVDGVFAGSVRLQRCAQRCRRRTRLAGGAARTGFDGYIGKPIEPATFVSQIEQFLPPALRAQRPAETEPAPEAALTSAADTAPPLALKGATILVVDDSPVNRELIRSTLEPFGYTLLFAEDVQQGWQRAQNNRFDLVVCDLHMPDEDGFSFIRRLRTDSRLASIPFMFLTASSGCDSDPGQAQALGAARFLRRPIEPQALVDQIDACLREVDEKGG